MLTIVAWVKSKQTNFHACKSWIYQQNSHHDPLHICSSPFKALYTNVPHPVNKTTIPPLLPLLVPQNNQNSKEDDSPSS
jgi:hypothetical protein